MVLMTFGHARRACSLLTHHNICLMDRKCQLSSLALMFPVVRHDVLSSNNPHSWWYQKTLFPCLARGWPSLALGVQIWYWNQAYLVATIDEASRDRL